MTSKYGSLKAGIKNLYNSDPLILVANNFFVGYSVAVGAYLDKSRQGKKLAGFFTFSFQVFQFYLVQVKNHKTV